METKSNEHMVAEYLAGKVIEDFIKGMIAEEIAGICSTRPWLDAIRARVSNDCVNKCIENFKRSHLSEGLANLSINIARAAKNRDVVPYLWEFFKGTDKVSVKISALLALASFGEMEDKWEEAFSQLRPYKDEIIRNSMNFYNVENKTALSVKINERLNDPSFSFNQPYYNFVIGLLNA